MVAFSQHIEGEDMLGSTGQAATDHYNLWSAGTLEATINLNHGGPYIISANVWGSVCDDGMGPDIELLVERDTNSNLHKYHFRTNRQW